MWAEAELPLLLLLLLSAWSAHPTQFLTINDGIRNAKQYLIAHYNPYVGLVYESEDRGAHWLGREIPEFSYKYSQTYWLTSDNLFASLALQPLDRDYSQAINVTIEAYRTLGILPSHDKFEAVAGIPAGPDRVRNNLVIERRWNYVIMAEVHNGSVIDSEWRYADNLVYGALTQFYVGNRTTARNMILQAYGMWNGTCIVDDAVTSPANPIGDPPTDHGKCTNYKIALLLFGAKVVGVELPDAFLMEALLWRQQIDNGGIASLSDGHGHPIGSANAETTSLTLMVYNDPLIQRNSVQSRYEASPTPDAFLRIMTGDASLEGGASLLRPLLARAEFMSPGLQ